MTLNGRNRIKQILMERDCMSSKDADRLIHYARKALMEALAEGDMDSAEEICQEWFDLEPDYLDDLL